MLAVRPDLTEQPQASDAKKNVEFSWDKPIIEVTPDGEIDDHKQWVANAQIGKELIMIYSENLVAKIRSLLEE